MSETQVAEVQTARTVIRPKTETMVKTAKGSFHKDDMIGHALAGLSLPQVKIIAIELGLDANKYAHLNVGQQRMNLGNGLRRLSANPEAAQKISDLAGPMQADNVEAAAAEAEAKQAAKEAKAAEKAAKPKKVKVAKVVDSDEGEGSAE